jgi:hypothetical protein
MGIERRYNVDSSVTSCLKMSHCLTKTSFLLFKQTYSHDVALVFSPRPQLRSSAREQEKNMAYVGEKEEDFS